MRGPTMKKSVVSGILFLISFSNLLAEKPSLVSIFNGKDLAGWEGDLKFWRVEDGSIIGETTPDKKLAHSTYLMYKKKTYENFVLTLEYKINVGNSGIQYRSRSKSPTHVEGYQADMVGPGSGPYNGILYEVGNRRIMAKRGEKVRFEAKKKGEVYGKVGDEKLLEAVIKRNDWNKYEIIADGPQLTHKINGKVMIQVLDLNHIERITKGYIGFQLHQGAPMKVEFRNVTITETPSKKASGQAKPDHPQPLPIEKPTPDKAKPIESKKPVSAPVRKVPVASGKVDEAKWIWHAKPANSSESRLRKTFEARGVKEAILHVTCDNGAKIYLNGKHVVTNPDWNRPTTVDVKKYLKSGRNELRAEATNDAPGIGGFIASLVIKDTAGREIKIQSDATWQAAAPKTENWQGAVVLAKYGDAPWGRILDDGEDSPVVPAAGLDLLPGFEAEHLYSVDGKTQGSWISMTFDDKGRLIATAERGWLYRLTFPKAGESGKTEVELLQIKEAKDTRGLLYAFDSLYVATDGVYRLQDTTGDDQFDKVTKILSNVTSPSEHGSHAMIVSADGKGINFINGNFSTFKNNMPSRQPPVWTEDSLLPHFEVAHANGVRAPGAWVCRFDPDGKNPVMLAGGMRNPCDLAINKDGELFTYDADMEYDMGNAWYRPTRVNHLTSGAEFGWRTGSQKWPEYYADSLGSVVDIGPGSPTGIAFGTKTTFPQRYRDSLYLCDWSYGVLYAVHMEEAGASYRGTKEAFATKAGFPLVDVEVGPDGTLYIMTGGWKNQSEIYRIRYTGKNPTASSIAQTDPHAKQLRALRRQIESFHHKVGAEAVNKNWQYLSHADRHIRYAARIAIENQPLELWQDKVFGETNPFGAIHAVIALIRHGDKSILEKTADKLNTINFKKLDKIGQLGLLRAYSLMFARWGQPSAAGGQSIISKLDPHYPASDRTVNKELCTLMSYLDSPSVVGKTVSLMATEKAQLDSYFTEAGESGTLKRSIRHYGDHVQKILDNQPDPHKGHYLYALKSVKQGWTLEYRKQYFSALKKSMTLSGGMRYHFYLDKIKQSALENTADEHKRSLDFLLKRADKAVDIAALPKAKGPGKAWTNEEVASLVKDGMKGRNFKRGQLMFQAAHCSACHQFNGSGGIAGPDLSTLGKRLSVKDIMVSINEPNKVINKFYEASEITLKDGSTVFGQVIEKTSTELSVMVNAYDSSNLRSVKLSDIKKIKLSAVSQMPPRLIAMFNKEELLDFMAYILSQGNNRHYYYKKKAL